MVTSSALAVFQLFLSPVSLRGRGVCLNLLLLEAISVLFTRKSKRTISLGRERARVRFLLPAAHPINQRKANGSGRTSKRWRRKCNTQKRRRTPSYYLAVSLFLINTYHTQCGQTKLSREWDGDGEIGATASQIRVCPPISSTLTRKRTSWKQIVAWFMAGE